MKAVRLQDYPVVLLRTERHELGDGLCIGIVARQLGLALPATLTVRTVAEDPVLGRPEKHSGRVGDREFGHEETTELVLAVYCDTAPFAAGPPFIRKSIADDRRDFLAAHGVVE